MTHPTASHPLTTALVVAVTALVATPALAQVKHSCPPPEPIGEITSTVATCEPEGIVNLSYVVVETGESIRMTMYLDPDSDSAFAEFHDADGRLLARLDADDGQTHTSHTPAGERVSRAVALSYGQALADPEVHDAIDACGLAYKCGSRIHKFLQGLCLASGVVCCAAALPACPGCALGAEACVSKTDSNCT